jgi:hypothetical protein
MTIPTNSECPQLVLDGAHSTCPVVEVELPEAMIQRNAKADRAKAELERAKALVRAAGYELKKPRRSNRPSKKGPTFVCRFADGITTRTSIYTKLDQLDWERGKRMAAAAYESRVRQAQPRLRAPHRSHPDYPAAYERWLVMRSPPIEVPAIAEAHFERDGIVLATLADAQRGDA